MPLWNGPLHRLRELCPGLSSGLWNPTLQEGYEKNTTGPCVKLPRIGDSIHLVLGEEARKRHVASGQASWVLWRSQSSLSGREEAGEDYLSRISKIHQTFPSLRSAQSLLKTLLLQLTRTEFCKRTQATSENLQHTHTHTPRPARALERTGFPNVVPSRGAGTAPSQNSGSYR